MKDAGTGIRTTKLGLPRPPRLAAFAVAAVIAGVRAAARGGANATVPAARRGYKPVAIDAGGKNRLRSNNALQRRPRSKVLTLYFIAARGPAERGR
jgi:hypothetical protein